MKYLLFLFPRGHIFILFLFLFKFNVCIYMIVGMCDVL